MDAYTRRTREWLDAIYEGPPGIPYVPHSPVHGFDPQARYLGTYSHLFAVLSEMARYEFDSVLEVGSGEGFLAEMVRRLFGARVAGVDLSHRVCRRAVEFFDLPCAVGEAKQLPFRDKSVDLVVSINTLEHIADIATAWDELRRIARVAVIVGLPHARLSGEHESDDEPHAHVSLLTQAEMRRLFGAQARLRGSVSRLARPLYALVARDDVSQRAGYERLRHPLLRPLYAVAHSIALRRDPRAAVAWLCRLEEQLCRLAPRKAFESIVAYEVDPSRRRREVIPAATILAELLR